MASSKRSILGERETVNVAITQVSDEDIASPERNWEVIDIFRRTVSVNLLGLPTAVVPVGMRDGFSHVVQIISPPLKGMRCRAAAEAMQQQVEALMPINPR